MGQSEERADGLRLVEEPRHSHQASPTGTQGRCGIHEIENCRVGKTEWGFDKRHGIVFLRAAMGKSTIIELPVSAGIRGFKLPRGVRSRLDALLDKQDGGQSLNAAERREAEGLVELAEFLSLLKLRARTFPAKGA